MAQIRKGILGGVNGSIGNVVGGSWKGIEYIRTKAASVSGNRSDVQIANRARFLTVIRFLRPITEFLRVGFQSLAVKQSAFNAATSYHYKYALDSDGADAQIDLSKVMVSTGILSKPYDVAVSSTEATKIVFSWTNNSGSGTAKADDTAMLVVIVPTVNEVLYLMNAGTRADAQATATLPNLCSGEEAHCYLCFARMGTNEGSNVAQVASDSVYAGVVTVS